MWVINLAPPNPISILDIIGAILSSLSCCISLLSFFIAAIALWFSMQDELSPEIDFSIVEHTFSVIHQTAALTTNIRNLGKRPISSVNLFIKWRGGDNHGYSHQLATLAPTETNLIDIGSDIYLLLKAKGILAYADAGDVLKTQENIYISMELKYKTKVGILERDRNLKYNLNLMWAGSGKADRWDVKMERIR